MNPTKKTRTQIYYEIKCQKCHKTKEVYVDYKGNICPDCLRERDMQKKKENLEEILKGTEVISVRPHPTSSEFSSLTLKNKNDETFIIRNGIHHLIIK